MILSWQNQAWEDYIYWQQNDKSKLKRVNELIKSTLRTPFEGIGNPEPLRHQLTGFWSRKIDSEHRLIYTMLDETIIIASCRYLY